MAVEGNKANELDGVGYIVECLRSHQWKYPLCYSTFFSVFARSTVKKYLHLLSSSINPFLGTLTVFPKLKGCVQVKAFMHKCIFSNRFVEYLERKFRWKAKCGFVAGKHHHDVVMLF